jgi:creatinine amidohydrolase/Fe(II)-dependent formamide hydrolase-like protein
MPTTPKSDAPTTTHNLLRFAGFTLGLIVCAFITMTVSEVYAKYRAEHRALTISNPPPDSPLPIAAHDSLYIEELTWMEVREAMKAGKTTVLIASGGVEQAGPYLAMGKHNYICRATTEAIARKLGDALIAPIIPFVPQGDIDPPTNHMKYAGTVSLSETTYEQLLTEIARCYHIHGFEHIIFIGDSFGNLQGMENVAAALSRQWQVQKTTIHYIPEYYNYAETTEWLAQQGIDQLQQGLHDDFMTTAMLLTVDPRLARTDERLAAGNFRINGIDLAPLENSIAWGHKIIDHRAEKTAAAIRRAVDEKQTHAQPNDQ